MARAVILTGGDGTTGVIGTMLWVSQEVSSAARLESAAQVAVPEPSPLALRYHRSGNVLWGIGTALSLLLPGLVLLTGASARLRTLSLRIGRRWFPSTMLYALLFTVLLSLLSLPLTFYAGFLRQHAYGLSNQSLDQWAADWVKGVLVSGFALALVLWLPYALMRRSPRRWWLYAGLAALPFATLVLIVSPVVVDPLFNTFGRMQDSELEARIVALAERAGIPRSRVYQVDKSADTKMVNAYVTGFGSTKRIVLWDTALAKLQPDEILFIVGHEMGHFVLRHPLALILLMTLLALASLYTVHRVSDRLIARYGHRFGFHQLSDFASFPLLTLLGALVSLVATPLLLAFTRYQEHEADRFALELTQNNRAAATAFVRLQQENLSVPRPSVWYVLWRGSHPSLGDRVDFANQYQPWTTGEPLRYRDRFR